MSLVVALAKSKEAVIGGDRRSITFLGSCPELEQDLYSGLIKDDDALLARAKEAGATLQVADGRDKVWRRGDILVGEVTEITPQLDRRRRIYVTPGAHLQVEISGNEVRVKDRGVAGCIIYGNRFTQQIAVSIVVQASGRVDEALVREIFQKAGEQTASVSREYVILRSERRLSDPQKALEEALDGDCQENGWRLCAPL
ncbi:DUF2121 domain-containing protein [Methanothrix sp.]|uniref:DUF2121 domain-containing protein n=1 Tax=Methanothrix sp. TaxID=90426 RepID=UPI003C71DC97